MSSNNKKKNTKPVENITTEEAVEIIEKAIAEEEPVKEKYNKAIIVNCEKVNFRQKPNKSSDVIEIIEAGREVEAAPFNNEWVKVRFNSNTGFIMSRFVEV